MKGALPYFVSQFYWESKTQSKTQKKSQKAAWDDMRYRQQAKHIKDQKMGPFPVKPL